MKATAELQVVPIGSGVSVRAAVGRAVEMLQERGDFIVETQASGTNVEGDLETILDAVREINHALHREGSVRLLSYPTLEPRPAKAPTLAGNRL